MIRLALVVGKLRDLWGKWRESRRQYQLERALYKAGGNPTGPTAIAEHASNTLRASGAEHWGVEHPKNRDVPPPDSRSSGGKDARRAGAARRPSKESCPDWPPRRSVDLVERPAER
jgi:hypothetical protein